MNISRVGLTFAAVLLAGSGYAAHHESKGASDWTEVRTATCSDIEFGDAVTSRFPEVAAACRGVVRDAKGTPYVVIEATVHHVRRDPRTRSLQNVTLDMLDVRNTSLRKLSIRPPRGFRFTVRGQEYSADYLTRGAELTLYLPSDRWEVVWSPETATPIDTEVFIEDIETYLVTATLEADEAFEFDSAELSPTGRADLNAILAVSGDYVPAITIFGYTDAIGEAQYNLALSQRRADAAKDYLVARGVPEWRIKAVGRGEENPIVVCEGVTGEARKACLAPNRRAEVAFLVPAVAESATVQVTKTYVKPLGETVTVTEEMRVAQLAETSARTTRFLDACRAEVENLCAGVAPGGGRVLGCLVANRQPDYGYSASCDAALATALDTVLFRRGRLNAVGSACSAEIAACDSVPLGGKLECVAEGGKSNRCSAALSRLADVAL